MVEQPLVSVIIPVYKVEKYLERCVQSVMQQTYRRIEIILVDDGSPDQCPAMCDKLAKTDDRIHVVHKSNGGLSDARNAGMTVAAGEYFCFVDSDDYIKTTMIEHLITPLKTAKAKMVITNFASVYESGERVEDRKSPIQNGVYRAETIMPKIYEPLGWYYIVAWNKLYHRSLFDKIQFPVGKIHEDEYVVSQLMWEAQMIACIDTEEYVYTYQRKGSIMDTLQVQAQCDWLEALYLRFQFCKGKEQLIDFAATTRGVYFRELNNLLLKSDLRNSITKEQKKAAEKQYAKMDEKTLTEKINWFLFRISPKFDHFLVKKVRGWRGIV